MKNSLLLFCLFVLILAASCSSSKRLTSENLIQKRPPGTVLFEGNLLLDETELTNLSWGEYLWWLSSNYSKESPKYLNALPDTTVWQNPEICYYVYSELYFRHPAYSDYPVVGLSQKQIREFCKWRSDRVMELILVRDERIIYQHKREIEDLFTIEKYYTDSLDYVIEDEKLEYYPEYRLPTLAERERILQKQDSIARSDYKQTRKDWKPWEEYYLSQIRADVPCCSSSIQLSIPTKNVFFGSYLGEFDNLRGNVSEFVEEDSISVGGSWYDSKIRIFECDTFHVSKPNAWTGFRNVCEWKKWTP